jgi:hypothetical protein
MILIGNNNECFLLLKDLFSMLLRKNKNFVVSIISEYLFVFLYSFACLHIHGRFRNLMKATATNYRMSTYPTFPVFCYYTHDIEDGIDATKGYRALGDGDFFLYNLLLLWILPPLSSTTIQICVLFGLIINVQIGIILTGWIGSLWKEYRMPALPLPVIFISAYALIIDFILQSLDIDNVQLLE